VKGQRDLLGWAALGAAIVVTASAEYALARACGFGTYVAAGVPAALDIYAIRALRAHKDVLAVVVAMIAVNAGAHLVEAGLLAVSWPLVVAVSAIAPLVLWRVHALRERPAEAAPESQAEPVAPRPELTEVPPVPVVPAGVRLLPLAARPAPPTVTLERERVPVLGDFAPLPELPPGFAGTGTGTGRHLAFARLREAAGTAGGTGAEPQAELPEPAAGTSGTASGSGAADIESEPSENTRFRAHIERARNWLESAPELTGTEIGRRLGASDSYGRRVRRAVQAGR
jgi:hypothetical protein